jgi:hypothetical protein
MEKFSDVEGRVRAEVAPMLRLLSEILRLPNDGQTNGGGGSGACVGGGGGGAGLQQAELRRKKTWTNLLSDSAAALGSTWLWRSENRARKKSPTK